MKTSQTEKSAQSITTLTPEEMKQVSGGLIWPPILMDPFQFFIQAVVASSFPFKIG